MFEKNFPFLIGITGCMEMKKDNVGTVPSTQLAVIEVNTPLRLSRIFYHCQQ